MAERPEVPRDILSREDPLLLAAKTVDDERDRNFGFQPRSGRVDASFEAIRLWRHVRFKNWCKHENPFWVILVFWRD
jgi:hypothetical protein